MVLVDTSVWINHLRDRDRHLEKLLFDGDVVCHTHIIGELACGNLKNRKEIISLLQSLPIAPVIEFYEYLFFIEQNQLSGKGMGFVDIHLLASAKLGQVPLWTADKKLKTVSADLDLNYKKKKGT
jgi:predicted nucleic acid-binding protein